MTNDKRGKVLNSGAGTVKAVRVKCLHSLTLVEAKSSFAVTEIY